VQAGAEEEGPLGSRELDQLTQHVREPARFGLVLTAIQSETFEKAIDR
jgi:hypothetical protein